MLEKDTIKETLFDTLGTGDVAWSQRLGAATYALLFVAADRLLAAGASLVVEANFFRGMEPRFADLPPHRLVQVHCDAPLETIVARYEGRTGSRHQGHLDDQRVDALRDRHASGLNGTLDLTGGLIELDTSAASPEELADDVLHALRTL